MQNSYRGFTIALVHPWVHALQVPLNVIVAGFILLLWLVSGVLLLQLPADWVINQWGVMLLGVIGRTILQTGLFITAHDGMHGLIWPTNKQWNDRIGQALLCLYGFLSYDYCQQKHIEHHHFPTQTADPDFHVDQRLAVWYAHFMGQYLANQQGWRVVSGVAIVLGAGLLMIPTQWPNLLLFWLLPFILSSWQLFYFGIYLPHRQPATGYTNPHCAKSLVVPSWVSFLLCYHFGYHWEHHEYPHLPWYELPRVKSWAQSIDRIGI